MLRRTHGHSGDKATVHAMDPLREPRDAEQTTMLNIGQLGLCAALCLALAHHLPWQRLL